MSDYKKILYATEAGIALVTLNRPDKRNALDEDVIRELSEAFAAAGRDASVRVVLLTGAGNDFCSGADLAGLQRSRDYGVEQILAGARNLVRLFVQMREHPRPIVAAVRGRALAGGCGLATATDIILAGESARFGYPEVNIGFIPAIVMAVLRRSVSEKRAFELITTGEVITAGRALDFGLINRVFPDDSFEESVKQYAAQLANKSASAVSLSKSLLYHIDGMSFEGAMEAGAQMNALARLTDDCRAGIDRFLKKP